MTTVNVYHGTGYSFESFSMDTARLKNDYYGGTLYFTDNLSVAKQYARATTSAAKRKNPQAQEAVYQCNLTYKKLFDVDFEYTGKELKKFIGADVEGFARAAGLLKYGVDKYEVLADLKSGNAKLTGDQVFKGLSKGMVDTAKTREKLKSLGYDMLRYDGGKQMKMATQHNVYCPYELDSIKIVKVMH